MHYYRQNRHNPKGLTSGASRAGGLQYPRFRPSAGRFCRHPEHLQAGAPRPEHPSAFLDLFLVNCRRMHIALESQSRCPRKATVYWDELKMTINLDRNQWSSHRNSQSPPCPAPILRFPARPRETGRQKTNNAGSGNYLSSSSISRFNARPQ